MALEARVDRLEAALIRLAEAQARTEERLSELAARVDALAARMDTLARHVDELATQMVRFAGIVGDMRGRILEADYRENAHSYFLRILLGIRSVSRDELESLAADAERRALLSVDEHDDLLQADVVVRGRLRDRDTDAFLVAEVSSVIDEQDVQRAARRARLLERITGAPVVAAVAGERIAPAAEQEAIALAVWRVVDGRARPPAD